MTATEGVDYRRLVKGGQKFRAAVFERDEAIVEAHRAGYSLRAIADAVQLSHESVRRIVARSERTGSE